MDMSEMIGSLDPKTRNRLAARARNGKACGNRQPDPLSRRMKPITETITMLAPRYPPYQCVTPSPLVLDSASSYGIPVLKEWLIVRYLPPDTGGV